MTVSAFPALNVRFKVGWFLLVVLSGLMASSYLILIFTDSEGKALFTSYTAFSSYAFLVLLIPFREGKKWAWMATWIIPVVLALTAYFAPQFAPYYYGSAVVFVVGLLLTMSEFFSNRKGK
jgi:MFS superfamily sulfate permease-like transporter